VERHAVETIVIDHHRGPSRIPGLEVRDVEAAATAEIVYAMLTGWGETISAEMATALYSAIAYDTGGFRYSNTRTRTHKIAADLMDLGADTDTANHWLFESVSVGRARLMARLLSGFDLSGDGKIAWMSLSQETMKDVGAEAEDVEGLVEVLRSLEGVEVAMLFKEVKEGVTKISLRSSAEADVEAFAREYGGGGHKNASGVLVEEPLPAAVDRVVADALERFNE
jgi:phosphoesterase RecJ-like protein